MSVTQESSFVRNQTRLMAVNQTTHTLVTYPLLVCSADQELAHTRVCVVVTHRTDL